MRCGPDEAPEMAAVQRSVGRDAGSDAPVLTGPATSLAPTPYAPHGMRKAVLSLLPLVAAVGCGGGTDGMPRATPAAPTAPAPPVPEPPPQELTLLPGFQPPPDPTPPPEYPGPAQPPDEELCGDWARLTVGDLVLYNNVWNAGSILNYEQCVMRRGDEIGWRWSWPGVARLTSDYHNPDHYVRAFPEVIYGAKPWDPSTTPRMPIRLSDLQELTVDFDAYMTASGDYNLAFNSWFTTGNPATEAGIAGELMIWIDRTDWTPQGSDFLAGNVVIDGREYSLYSRRVFHTLPDRGHDYLAFAAHEDQFSGTLEIKKFLDFLIAEGLLSESLYIAGLELGNEVLDGSGEIWFKEYRVTAR